MMQHSPGALNPVERRAITALALVFGLRMFGLFLVLPVLALYAAGFPAATPIGIGLAVGAYGLTQAMFQMPFGWLSDRFGRKALITLGLMLFVLGSVVAAEADTLVGLIGGRALQGAGAIAAVVLALLADVTREQQRIKATALVGSMIGAAFLTALMAGSALAGGVGVRGLFYTAAVTGLVVLPVLWWAVPTPSIHSGAVHAKFPERWRELLLDRHLLRLDLGVFVQHFALMALFVVVPSSLIDVVKLPSVDHWKVYVPVLAVSIVVMLPLLVFSMRRTRTYPALHVALLLMLLAALLLAGLAGLDWGLVVGLTIFFTGFNLLEALLPSLVSRVAMPAARGAALGVYNTCQFAGVFAGGVAGGLVYGVLGPPGVYTLVAVLLGLWWLVMLTAAVPQLMDTVTVYIADAAAPEVAQRIVALRSLPGVQDVTVIRGQDMAYLKVDPLRFHNGSLDDIDGVAVG